MEVGNYLPRELCGYMGSEGQFVGIDFFENLKVSVVFMGYDSFNIGFIILLFLQISIDFIE
jgi:hypothetical protein